MTFGQKLLSLLSRVPTPTSDLVAVVGKSRAMVHVELRRLAARGLVVKVVSGRENRYIVGVRWRLR